MRNLIIFVVEDSDPDPSAGLGLLGLDLGEHVVDACNELLNVPPKVKAIRFDRALAEWVALAESLNSARVAPSRLNRIKRDCGCEPSEIEDHRRNQTLALTRLDYGAPNRFQKALRVFHDCAAADQLETHCTGGKVCCACL